MSDETVGGFRRMDTEKDNNPGVAMYGEKWQYPPRSSSETAYLWSDGIWRTSAEPIPAIDFDRRTAACLRACVGVPTEALEQAGECAVHGVIPTLAAQYLAARDALHATEMEWERSMMDAIGEDGVKSVSDAIKRLRTERSMLIDALRDIYNRRLSPGPATGVDAIFCFRQAQTALDKIERR